MGGAGGSRLLEPEAAWAGAYVAVWARVDLGFRALFYSDPLILGLRLLPEKSRRSRCVGAAGGCFLWQSRPKKWRLAGGRGPGRQTGGGEEGRPHE